MLMFLDRSTLVKIETTVQIDELEALEKSLHECITILKSLCASTKNRLHDQNYAHSGGSTSYE